MFLELVRVGRHPRLQHHIGPRPFISLLIGMRLISPLPLRFPISAACYLAARRRRRPVNWRSSRCARWTKCSDVARRPHDLDTGAFITDIAVCGIFVAETPTPG